jgi:hypothetical protein
LAELKIQLQDLLDKSSIQVHHHGVVQPCLWKRKTIAWVCVWIIVLSMR